MDTEPRWEEPPFQKTHGWTIRFVAQLREHPGRWAKVIAPDGRDDFATNRVMRFRELGCEARSSGIGLERGRVMIWARWPKDSGDM